MKFEIDMDKLREEVLKKKGRQSIEYCAFHSHVNAVTLARICGSAPPKDIITANYFSLCHWLGVSAYYFIREQN